MDGGVVLLVILGAALAVPWLVGKVFVSVNRNVVSRGNNQRAVDNVSRQLRFSIPGVSPKEVSEAVRKGAGFETKVGFSAKVYLVEWGDELLRFEFTKSFSTGPGWVAAMILDSVDGGTDGGYGLIDALEMEGRAVGVKEMAQTFQQLERFLRARYPAIEITSR
jgi:hypothetical protein